MNLKQFRVFLPLMIALLSGSVVAKEKQEWRSWPMGERVVGSIAIYSPSLDTRVAIGGSEGNAGALISFEQNLGLSENKSTVFGYLDWRFFKRHSLSFNYFELNRSSSNAAGVLISFGGESFEANLPVNSFFDIEATEIHYNYSILFDHKKNLSIGIGVSLQNLGFGLQQTEDCGLPVCDDLRASYKTTVPLPALNARWTYAFTDKWLLDIGLSWLAVELDLDNKEDLEGSIWSATSVIRWKTWQHIGFNFGYKRLDLDVDYRKRDAIATLDYEYKGLVFGIEGYY